MATKMRMRAVFNCSADEPGEISFKEGDILIDVEESGEDGWYIGTIENTSERGLFPYNYVERISESSPSDDTSTANITIPTTKSTWKATNDKTILPGFPALDAFEIAMSSGKGFKAASSAPTLSNSPPAIISPKPKLNTGLGIKKIVTPPAISEKPKISPTRSRSYSASTALTNKTEPSSLRPSQLSNGKGTTKSALELALSKGPQQSNLRSNSFSKSSGVALVGLANLKSNDSINNDVEDEDGYQMVKPSQLRQRQQQSAHKPIASTSSKPVIWKKASVTPSTKLDGPVSTKLDVPVSSNPMPRLPSRPVSTASKRSRNSRFTPSPCTTPNTTNVLPAVKETEKTIPPPILKPKPVLASQPFLPPRPTTKLRSTSNPPPIQPKPAMSSIEILLSKNAEKKNTETMSKTPPRVTANKPIVSMYQPKPLVSKASVVPLPGTAKPVSIPNFVSRPSLDSWRSEDSTDVNLKPSALLNRGRSATNPISNTSVDWSSVLTKPKSSSVLKPTVEKILDTKPIKKAPPPPPSRCRNKSHVMDDTSRHRYEILFDSIHDDGFVDGETARFIWLKSKLSNEELCRVWKECDPDHKGLLDKHAFIDGMGRIDAMLLNKQITV